jgi:thioredoxin reductase (NADPH)
LNKLLLSANDFDLSDFIFTPLPRDPFSLEACQPGAFAAGDVRENAMNRIASAVGEGAMVVSFVHKYLSEV